MSALAHQQQMLLAALFEWPPQNATKKIAACAMDTGARGIKAYQANGHALAQRALQAAYPVLHQLVGDESFGDLARALWHTDPPQRGDIGQWGEALAVFVQSSTQLVEEPYLSEVAQAEWAMHVAANAANATPDLATLALLTSEDPSLLTLTLAPGSRVLRCQWPVASVINAHLVGEPAFEEAGLQLRNHTPQDLVVWREGFQPRVRVALAGEHDAVHALSTGLSLAEALECAPMLDFSIWFPMALQSGLVTGVTPCLS